MVGSSLILVIEIERFGMSLVICCVKQHVDKPWFTLLLSQSCPATCSSTSSSSQNIKFKYKPWSSARLWLEGQRMTAASTDARPLLTLGNKQKVQPQTSRAAGPPAKTVTPPEGLNDEDLNLWAAQHANPEPITNSVLDYLKVKPGQAPAKDVITARPLPTRGGPPPAAAKQREAIMLLAVENEIPVPGVANASSA